jgi:HEAT repeat protein
MQTSDISVENLVLSLVKSIKAIQMYGLSHPSAKGFYTRFYHQLTGFLSTEPELTLQIEQFSMLCNGETVYHDEEKDSNIAFRLFRDGIRTVLLSEGITFDELLLFLETVGIADKDQDIALSLWDCYFDHIEFYVVEEEEQEAQFGPPKIIRMEIDYDEKLNEILEKERITLDRKIELELSDDEINELKAEMLIKQKIRPVTRAITTLIDFLHYQKSDDIIKSLVELLEECVVNGLFYDARRIVHKLNQYPDVDAVKRFENEESIMGFSTIVNIASEPVFNEFVAFVGFYSKKSVPFLIRLLGAVKHPSRMTALRNRIVYINQGDLELLKPLLAAKDPLVLVNTISIVGLTRSQEIPELLIPLRTSPNHNIRIAVISALAQCGDAPGITPFIDDVHPDVRIKALQALSEVGYTRIYMRVLDRIKQKKFRALELVEQKEYFNYLLHNGGRFLVNDLKRILFKRMFFRGKDYLPLRKLAALSLARVNSKDARQVLLAGIGKRNKDIRQACEQALKQP